jgi:DNA-binding GntR family transcriptional regulator
VSARGHGSPPALPRPGPELPTRTGIPRVGAGTSLTRQVLEAMLSAIQRGAFASGRLPPEDELARQLAVSRTTVRRALQSMEQIGLIERRPGRGTRLRINNGASLLALHGLVPFPTLLRELGHQVSSHVSWQSSDEVPAELATRLGREMHGGSYLLDVVLLADGQPAVHMLERFPTDVLEYAPSEEDLQAGSILFVSDRCFRDPIDHAVATLEPAVASAQPEGIGAALKLEAGSPYLALHETFSSADDFPLATSDVALNPAFVSFSVFRRFL